MKLQNSFERFQPAPEAKQIEVCFRRFQGIWNPKILKIVRMCCKTLKSNPAPNKLHIFFLFIFFITIAKTWRAQAQ